MKFIVTLTDKSNNTGSFDGKIIGKQVLSNDLVWKTSSTDMHTIERVSITFVNGPSITMNGNIWQNLEEAGAHDEFLRLAALDENRANAFVSLAEKSPGPYYRVILVRDAGTESCTVYTTTDNEEDALDQQEDDHLNWVNNENSPESADLCGGREDFEEVDLDDVVRDLLTEAVDNALRMAKAKSYDQTLAIAAMLQFGEQNEDGDVFRPDEGFKDSHNVLMNLIKSSREILQAAQQL